MPVQPHETAKRTANFIDLGPLAGSWSPLASQEMPNCSDGEKLLKNIYLVHHTSLHCQGLNPLSTGHLCSFPMASKHVLSGSSSHSK